MVEVPAPGKFPRNKVRANKRQHKARRIRELLKEQRALSKAERRDDKRRDRRLARIEAAFEGCEVQ